MRPDMLCVSTNKEWCIITDVSIIDWWLLWLKLTMWKLTWQGVIITSEEKGQYLFNMKMV